MEELLRLLLKETRKVRVRGRIAIIVVVWLLWQINQHLLTGGNLPGIIKGALKGLYVR